MTVLTTTSDIQYNGNIGQTTFAYNFRVDEKTDMVILLDDSEVAQGDFTMTGLGSSLGGSVILNTGLVAAVIVTLSRNIEATQEVDYQPFDAFPAETHEGALDKLTMLVQQTGASVLRALRFPLGDTASPVLPDVAGRALRFLAFDNSGNISLTLGTGGGDPNAVQKPPGAVVSGNFMEFDSFKNAVDSGLSHADLINLMHPVTCVREFTSGVNPNILYPGTTWQSLNEGEFLISQGPNYPAGSTGGAADSVTIEHSHLFTGITMAAHEHPLRVFAIAHNAGEDSSVGFGTDSGPAGTVRTMNSPNNRAEPISAGTPTGNIALTGVTGTGLNLPPYRSVYRWERLPDAGSVTPFDAHWARVTDKSDPTLETDLRQLFDALINNGLYTVLDDLCVLHTNAADSLLGLKGFQDSITAGPVPDWGAGKGYSVGDAANPPGSDPNLLNYVDTQIFDSGITQLSTDSESIFFSQVARSQADAGVLGTMGAVNEVGSGGDNDLSLAILDDNNSEFVGATAGLTVGIARGNTGFFLGTRDSANSSAIVTDSLTNTSAVASSGNPPTANTVFVGGVNNVGVFRSGIGTKDMVAWGVGGGLTAIQGGALRDILNTYTVARLAQAPIPEFDAHWARVVDKGDPALEGHLKQLFRDLLDSGVYDLLDDLSVIHLTSADSLLGLKGFADAETSGNPFFSASTGHVCGKTSTPAEFYINSQLNPVAAGSQMLPESTAIFCYRTDRSSPTAGATATMGVDSFNIVTTRTAIRIIDENSTNSQINVSNTLSVDIQPIGGNGFCGYSRISANNYVSARNGTIESGTTAGASVGIGPAEELIVGGTKDINGVYQHELATENMVAWGAGAGLDATQLLALDTAVTAYLTSRGVN